MLNRRIGEKNGVDLRLTSYIPRVGISSVRSCEGRSCSIGFSLLQYLNEGLLFVKRRSKFSHSRIITYLREVQKMNAVAYYRVSTARQGASGLGIAAQRAMVTAYSENIVAEYRDVESGRKTDRPQLQAAIEHCQREGAVLLIAKLDRLYRNMAATSALMESGIDFIACDMPEANKLTIHILAAIAEYEADLVSERTKAALAEAKKRGVKLGTPANLTPEARAKGPAARRQKAIEGSKQATALAVSLRAQGRSLQQIADELKAAGFKSPRGKWYSPGSVKRLLDRVR